MKLHKLFAALMLGLLPSAVCADAVSVAVASNFTPAMNEIAATFEKETGYKIQSAFGASGKFYAQIRNGAPFQVFLSADEKKPLQLEQDGLTVAGTRFTYAIGTLALWSAKPDLVDRKGEVLKRDNFNKLAIANPRLAPYGEAAIEVLQHLKIDKNLEPKLVYGENIAQTYQFVETGNAELGFVALSQIMENGKLKAGSAWVVPAKLHVPIRQDGVLLKGAAENKAAQELMKFLRSEKARSIIVSYGYQTAVD